MTHQAKETPVAAAKMFDALAKDIRAAGLEASFRINEALTSQQIVAIECGSQFADAVVREAQESPTGQDFEIIDQGLARLEARIDNLAP